MAVFDDFRAGEIKFNWLLRLLDRYHLNVPIKGGFTAWTPKYIFITCPRLPRDEFINHETKEAYEDLEQIERRCTIIMYKLKDAVTKNWIY